MRRGKQSVVWLMLSIFACTGESEQPPAPDYAAIIEPADNPTTEAGIALGEQLFFDPLLSEDGRVSCATCHQPARAFTDGRTLAVGVYERVGTRNTPTLTNIGYHHKPLFWDGRANNLEAQAMHPIGTSHEMGGSWPAVVEKLRGRAAYMRAFSEAFGSPAIDSLRVGKALAQYQRSLISNDTKYDRVLRGEAQFSEAEALGHAIFFDAADDPGSPFADIAKGECAHCHTAPHFTNQRYENNGLEAAPTLTEFADPGRGAISGSRYDNGKFRIPGLRNVALTAPYMHDGRFATLEEVVEHYNAGGQYAENKSPNVRPLGMTEDEKRALVAFLHTLTDRSFVGLPEE